VYGGTIFTPRIDQLANEGNRHVFCSFPAAGLKGLPDGATVDAEGFVWSVSVYEGK
jgi:sugar lactone lactonase YvrE